MRVLAFAASLKKGSLNHRLISLAAEIARAEGAEVDFPQFEDFDMPLYDGDLDVSQGLPEGALLLKQKVEAADALILSVPEYNYSIPGTFKNAIDWVSRARPMPWRGRSVYLMSASPSPMGGIRGLWQTRIPLEGCGAIVFPDMFALPHAQEAFSEAGQLKDAALAARLEKELVGFLRLAEAMCPVITEARTGAPRARRERIVAALEDQTEIQSHST
ncbi:NAD(P)H-dependent oxidoreductase [Myxococcaceae bacterium GXIMD 01537]